MERSPRYLLTFRLVIINLISRICWKERVKVSFILNFLLFSGHRDTINSPATVQNNNFDVWKHLMPVPHKVCSLNHKMFSISLTAAEKSFSSRRLNQDLLFWQNLKLSSCPSIQEGSQKCFWESCVNNDEPHLISLEQDVPGIYLHGLVIAESIPNCFRKFVRGKIS